MLAKLCQQFINKLYTTTNLPGMQEWFNIGKSVNVLHHINRIKEKKNHMIILKGAEKVSNKMQYLFS